MDRVKCLATYYKTRPNSIVGMFKSAYCCYISQDQLNAIIDVVTVREDSLDYAIARDKLIDIQVLPDDPIVKSNDNYWNKFKENRDNKHI